MSYELYKKAVYVVNRDNKAAWSAMLKLAANCQPGKIIPVTGDEFQAIKDGMIILMPPPSDTPTNTPRGVDLDGSQPNKPCGKSGGEPSVPPDGPSIETSNVCQCDEKHAQVCRDTGAMPSYCRVRRAHDSGGQS